jgi:hypothetical protein
MEDGAGGVVGATVTGRIQCPLYYEWECESCGSVVERKYPWGVLGRACNECFERHPKVIVREPER